ncbi:choline ABC transporter permease subunit [Rhodobacter capsulatus]|uniref:choline ABC transporter permease subunit n=1 Tax=Rhodobacter capsulatus TaxID=1061 RepID=UPI0040274851
MLQQTMRLIGTIAASIFGAILLKTVLEKLAGLMIGTGLISGHSGTDLFTGKWKIPVGPWAKHIFEWMRDSFSLIFDHLAAIFETLINWIMAIFATPLDISWITGAAEYTPLYPPEYQPFIMTGFFLGISWFLQRRVSILLTVLFGLLYVFNQGYWKPTTESLTLVISACVVCMSVGVPIGIAAAHRPRLYLAMQPILDLMQTLPTFVYLIPAIVFFGIGMVPGLIATVIFVLPAPIRLTHLGVSTTPQPLLEAAKAFGATPGQVLWKVELPYALPQIMAGLNQTIMLSLSMVVIAALVGANGLGVPVVRALNSVNTALGFESGMIIVVVAIVLDRMMRFGGSK